jgi:hypothetical protein
MRNYIVAVGSLFNNTVVQRFDPETGVATRQIKVPLTYSAKGRWYSHLEAEKIIESPTPHEPTGETDVRAHSVRYTLPRTAFNLVGYNYDPTRKLNSLSKHVEIQEDTSSKEMKIQYQRVPYIFNFEVYGAFKETDDYLQWVEQTLPAFQPDLVVNVNDIPALSILHDATLTLTSVTPDIEYTGDREANIRAIFVQLDLELDGYLYQPTTTLKPIEKTFVSTFAMPTNFTEEDIIDGEVAERSATFSGEYQEIVFAAGSVVGDFQVHEIFYEGDLENTATKRGSVVEWDSGTRKLTVASLDVFESGDIIRGPKSAAVGTVNTYEPNITRT